VAQHDNNISTVLSRSQNICETLQTVYTQLFLADAEFF
jgi:hypothetical protein